MDKGILNEVIEAEKDIHACIEQEPARLREAVERAKQEAAETVAAAERELGTARERDLESVRQEAKIKAGKIVEHARERAARLERVDDGALTGIIMKQIPRILME